MKVKKTLRTISKTQKIPMDREMTKYLGEFFGRSIINTTPYRDTDSLTYTLHPKDGVRLDYVFNNAIRNEIKKQLKIKDDEIKTGRLANKFWLSLIVFAYEEPKRAEQFYKITGKFKYSDVAKLWGVKKHSGKFYSDIRNLFISMASCRFVRKTQRRDKTETEVYGLISYAKIVEKKGKEDTTEFNFELDERALSITADWIRWDRISLSQQQEGYFSVPVSDLSESVKDVNWLNFRERLRLFKGGYVSGKKILEEWIKLNPNKLNRREYCSRLLKNCLEKAKKTSDLRQYTLTMPMGKDWLEKWSVLIVKNGGGVYNRS
jgi:hypothetical protein